MPTRPADLQQIANSLSDYLRTGPAVSNLFTAVPATGRAIADAPSLLQGDIRDPGRFFNVGLLAAQLAQEAMDPVSRSSEFSFGVMPGGPGRLPIPEWAAGKPAARRLEQLLERGVLSTEEFNQAISEMTQRRALSEEFQRGAAPSIERQLTSRGKGETVAFRETTPTPPPEESHGRRSLASLDRLLRQARADEQAVIDHARQYAQNAGVQYYPYNDAMARQFVREYGPPSSLVPPQRADLLMNLRGANVFVNDSTGQIVGIMGPRPVQFTSPGIGSSSWYGAGGRDALTARARESMTPEEFNEWLRATRAPAPPETGSRYPTPEQHEAAWRERRGRLDRQFSQVVGRARIDEIEVVQHARQYAQNAGVPYHDYSEPLRRQLVREYGPPNSLVPPGRADLLMNLRGANVFVNDETGQIVGIMGPRPVQFAATPAAERVSRLEPTTNVSRYRVGDRTFRTLNEARGAAQEAARRSGQPQDVHIMGHGGDWLRGSIQADGSWFSQRHTP